MKKILVLMMIFLFFVPNVCIGGASGYSLGAINSPINNTDAFKTGRVGDDFTNALRAIDALNLDGSETGTGSIFFVDSNVSSAGAGTSWTTAKATIQEGIDLCTPNVGDIVYVASNHNEDINAASALNANEAGIIIHCFGKGEEQATISLITNAGAEFTISANDVTIFNLRILGAYAGGVTAGMVVTADGDGTRLIDCEFWETSNTMEQLIMISVATDADELVIAGCRFIGTDSSDPTSAIYFAGGSDFTAIQGNTFIGTWSASVVDVLQAASTGLMIRHNDMINLDATAGMTIDVHASSYGPIAGNRCYANGAGFAIVGNAMFVAPDNIAMNTEDIETRNYATMFGPYRGDAAGTAGDSVFADAVLAQTDLDAILIDTASIVVAIAAMNDSGYTGTNAGTSQTVATVSLLTGFGDDYFNTEWSMIIIHNVNSAGNAPEGEIRDITDYESVTGEFTIETTSANMETGDQIMVKRTEDLELDNPTMMGSASTIRYVDSGTSGDGSGLTWENAYATVTLAEAACAAGDAIYVADGHDEEVTTGTLVLNIANISVIGMGEGDGRGLITITDDGILMTIDAAGITVKNLRLQAGVTVCDTAIRVEDAGIGVTIDNVSIIDGEATTVDEFVDVISVDQAASNLTVKNCTYYSLDATGHTNSFIDLGETTIDSPTIIGCTIFGEFAEAPIWGGASAVPVNVLIKDNTISNTLTGQLCIEFTGAATGIIENNVLSSDSYATMLDPGEMKCIGNLGADTIDQQAIAVPLSAETSDVTEVSAGSDLERLEWLQRQADDVAARLGIDSAADNVWYVDNSATGAATGTEWTDAEVTLKAAIDNATDSTGAYIFMAANHVETIGASVAINSPGITIIGLGVQEARPKLTFNATASSLAHTVANVKYVNIIFICSTQDTTVAISLDGSSDGAVFEDCEFRNTGAFEFIDTVTLAAATDNVRFTRVKFLNNTAAGGNISAINSTAGVTNNLVIEDSDFYGAFTTAAIESTQVEVNLTIRNNTIYNSSTGDFAIKLSAAALGTLSDNRLSGDTLGAILDPGSMRCFGNTQTVVVDAAAMDVPLVAGKTYVTTWTEALYVSDDAWTVGGGPILITNLIGQITEAYDGRLDHTWWCNAGTAAYDIEFTDTVDIDAYLIGSRIVYSNANPALIANLTAGANNGGGSSLMSPWYCPIGTIETLIEAPAATAGNIIWYMTFIPLAENVVVVAQ